MPDPSLVHLVDDDAAVRRSAGFMLKTAGFRVEGYETAAALLNMASASKRGAS